MVRVKFMVIHYDALLFGRKSYFEVVDPSVEIQDRTIIVKGKNGEIVAVLPDLDRLIFVSAKPVE
jgi:hypothetical protein